MRGSSVGAGDRPGQWRGQPLVSCASPALDSARRCRRPGRFARSRSRSSRTGSIRAPTGRMRSPTTCRQSLRSWRDADHRRDSARRSRAVSERRQRQCAPRSMPRVRAGRRRSCGRRSMATLEATRLLLERGADPNLANEAGATALMWAIPRPRQSARCCSRSGADPNARSKDGRTPLMIAAGISGASDVVKLLLDQGANHRRGDAEPVRTDHVALTEAAYAGDEATFRLLLERGRDPKIGRADACWLCPARRTARAASTLMLKDLPPPLAERGRGALRRRRSAMRSATQFAARSRRRCERA